MPYCQKCGEQIPEGSLYCEKCGGTSHRKTQGFVNIFWMVLWTLLLMYILFIVNAESLFYSYTKIIFEIFALVAGVHLFAIIFFIIKKYEKTSLVIPITGFIVVILIPFLMFLLFVAGEGLGLLCEWSGNELTCPAERTILLVITFILAVIQWLIAIGQGLYKLLKS